MAPVKTDPPPAASQDVPQGPHPSYIQIARPYIFEQQIQEALASVGTTEAKEANNRLQGVAWIDTVRKALNLPVRTYDVAAVCYHKFRLVHADSEYNYIDAATAALFHACKVMDTLKKSKEILCAAHNLKVSAAERVASDDPMFDTPSRTITGLERMMLESSSFDFRNRYPQPLVIKLAKLHGISKETGFKAYYVSLDLYRTFAPLKQTTSTMAFSCIELATRICDERSENLENGNQYSKLGTSRECVMETILDLLDLYTNYRTSTIVGASHAIETFIDIRIVLNQEATKKNLPRFTYWREGNDTKNGVSMTNGLKDGMDIDKVTSPTSPVEPTIVNGTSGRLGDRGRDGTVRFMLNPERAREEKKVVGEFFDVQEEEYELEIERPARQNER